MQGGEDGGRADLDAMPVMPPMMVTPKQCYMHPAMQAGCGAPGGASVACNAAHHDHLAATAAFIGAIAHL